MIFLDDDKYNIHIYIRTQTHACTDTLWQSVNNNVWWHTQTTRVMDVRRTDWITV